MRRVGLLWFNNDLRINDNATLLRAAQEVDQLICLALVPHDTPAYDKFKPFALSTYRREFLHDSLSDLDRKLNTLGQQLIISHQTIEDSISTLITQYNISQVYCSRIDGVYEQRQWQNLTRHYPMIGFHQVANNRLFDPTQLPFATTDLPNSFSKFRRKVASIQVANAVGAPSRLPSSPPIKENWKSNSIHLYKHNQSLFKGGESSAQKHLTTYFLGRHASTYKETRNGLDGMDYSTKFSPWLANGCLSPRQVLTELRRYEQKVGSNESTYWIYFELLWREYFKCYADKYGQRLYAFSGISNIRPTTSFYPQRFKKWCSGNTPYPIVNACMNQLNNTGYMSNRGRQLVASCLVHELNLDWRYGASYMEQQLIDYDMTSNWGNWQYLAGVGADPRGHRRFDLEKQTQIYDPKGDFIRRWQGDKGDPTLDSNDIADWPITSPKIRQLNE
ncbi:MAG: DASH family cryptochrome [Porticoccaceae bacterium]